MFKVILVTLKITLLQFQIVDKLHNTGSLLAHTDTLAYSLQLFKWLQ